MYKRVGDKVLYISPLAEQSQAVEVTTEKKVKTKRKKK